LGHRLIFKNEKRLIAVFANESSVGARIELTAFAESILPSAVGAGDHNLYFATGSSAEKTRAPVAYPRLSYVASSDWVKYGELWSRKQPPNKKSARLLGVGPKES
jgi:hypothetical protein